MCWYRGGILDFQEIFDLFRGVNHQAYISIKWEGWFRGRGNAGRNEPGGCGPQKFDCAARAGDFLYPYLKA